MKKAYLEITELTDEQFRQVSEAENAFTELKKIMPKAIGYTTCFAYNGKVYHADTWYDGEKCKIGELHHDVGKVVKEIPTREVIVEVAKPNTYSESLLLKAISAASLGYSSAE
jgi:hypothetical protein